jgi:formiminoglutamase
MYQTFSPGAGSSFILLSMDSILNQSRPERAKESLTSLLSHGIARDGEMALLLAPSDHGVLRNGGRAGARWAPQAILSSFKKLANGRGNTQAIKYSEVTSQDLEAEGFEKAIELQMNLIRAANKSSLVHLGGGHDHILPLLKAFDQSPLCVINIDAHLDTRIDPEPHSGNPFRLFDQTCKHSLTLHQIGIHPFANSLSTQTKLANGQMHILWKNECADGAHLNAFLTRIEQSLTPETKIIFSLDCDALSASDVEAVSAPNHDGLSIELVKQLIHFYRHLCLSRGQKTIWGIYEFNPLYDSVSSRSARTIAGLMYEMLF